MALRLAGLFGCSLGELFQRVSPQEFDLWVAFYKLEPWGYKADNYHAGLVSSAVANHSGQLSEMVPPSFFMDNSEKSPAPESAPFEGDVDAEVEHMIRVLER